MSETSRALKSVVDQMEKLIDGKSTLSREEERQYNSLLAAAKSLQATLTPEGYDRPTGPRSLTFTVYFPDGMVAGIFEREEDARRFEALIKASPSQFPSKSAPEYVFPWLITSSSTVD